MKKFAEQRLVGCSYDPKPNSARSVSGEDQKFHQGLDQTGRRKRRPTSCLGRRNRLSRDTRRALRWPDPSSTKSVKTWPSARGDLRPGPPINAREGLRRGINHLNNSRFAKARASSPRVATTLASLPAAPMPAWWASRGHPGSGSFFPFARPQGLSFFGESHVFGLDGIHSSPRTKCRDTRVVHQSRQEGEEGRHLEGTVNG